MSNVLDFSNLKTVGERLRSEFYASISPDDLLSYKKKASDILDELAEEVKSNIRANKPPIAQKDTMKSNSGIFAPNKELEDLFNDYKFSVIIGDLAKERHLKIDFQARPIGIDKNTRQPVLGVILICTFE